eukprot:TRINITY_DN3540_c0_g1_i3.p2 TRINITY_DN3540_c0_g1~~TRINITY_DN3540_c0_g1_i3.p2  ORF type:complete len:157 (-),score=48.67 TRINITY_DN3540_c0_g1_i3:122-592(-)
MCIRDSSSTKDNLNRDRKPNGNENNEDSDHGDDQDGGEDGGMDVDEDAANQSPSKRQRREEPVAAEAEEPAAAEDPAPAYRTFDDARDTFMISTLIEMIADDELISITTEELLARANSVKSADAAVYSLAEVEPLLEHLANEQRIMVDEGIIYKIV